MKNNKIVIASILALVGTSAVAQSSAKENFEASAKIENFCNIQANDVNFGVVNLPLTAQSASSQMRVLCTNNTPYKVDLNYGQYVMEESSASGYTIEYSHSNAVSSTYFIRNSAGTFFGTLTCGYTRDYTGNYMGKVYLDNLNTAKLYGYKSGEYVNAWMEDTKDICVSSGNGSKSGTYPTGWVGAYNASTKQAIKTVMNTEFGSMSGTQKGDKLAYKVTLPEDSSKTWTKGLNAYNSTGTGAEQLITVNAQIVPDKSSSKYVAQDVYIDNITAEVTY